MFFFPSLKDGAGAGIDYNCDADFDKICALLMDPVLDNPYMDLAQHFDACIEFIDGARRGGGAVLVHCFAGRSRRYFLSPPLRLLSFLLFRICIEEAVSAGTCNFVITEDAAQICFSAKMRT